MTLGASISDMLKSSLSSPKQRIQKHLSKAIESQEGQCWWPYGGQDAIDLEKM